MTGSRARRALPAAVRRALKQLGEEISVARRRRRIQMGTMAERALVSRNTLTRVERGDPGVSMGIYATVLFMLGMSDRLAGLADPSSDRIGLSLDETRLPKRVRTAKGLLFGP